VTINQKMMATWLKKEMSRLPLVVLAAISVIFGCNGGSGTGGIPAEVDYQVRGALVADWNRVVTRAEVTISRNDTLLDSAQIWIGSQTLSYDPVAASYQLTTASPSTFPRGTHELVLVDLPDLVDTVLFDIADSFFVRVSNPPNRENPGGDVVTLDWTESPGTDAYVMAVVPKDLAYTGAGYSERVGSSEGTIPISAFRWSDGVAVDTGMYYVFAYSYIGAPDSAASANILPVPLPGNRTANIDQSPISGRFGTVVVTGRDSVHVTTQ
jgi:hypothetical protein